MKILHLIILTGCLVTAACRENKAAPTAAPEPPKFGLAGTRVSISLNRSVLGLSLDKPVSREAGTINGVETSIVGYIQKETDHFLVLSRHPPRGENEEHDESLLWIPYSSILTVRQQYPGSKGGNETADRPESWRFEAVQGLMNLVGIDLSQVPEGNLEVWVERNGKSDSLCDVATHPGHEQWLYLGIEPYKSEALVASVVSEENRGSSIVFVPLDDPKPFQKAIPTNPDWKESVLLAAENSGAGAGKVYARLTRNK